MKTTKIETRSIETHAHSGLFAFNECMTNSTFVDCLNELNHSRARYELVYSNQRIYIDLQICVRNLYDNTNDIVCISDDLLSDLFIAYKQMNTSALRHYRITNFLQYIEHCFAFHQSLRF